MGSNNNSTTFSGALAGLGGLTKIGAGTLVLAGSNSYGGGTTINAGAVQFNTSVPTGAGSIIVNAGGALAAAGVNNTVNAWLSTGLIAPSSSGAIALTPANADGDVNFTSPNAYNSLSLGAVGNVTYGGTIEPGSNGYLLGGGGGTLFLSALQTSLSGAYNITVVGPGAIDLGGGTLSTANNIIFAGGTVQDGTINGSGTYTLQGGTISTALGGTAGLTKTTTAVLVLANTNNSYSGGTNLSAGVLSFAASTLPGTITFGGGTLQWYASNTQDVSGQIAAIPGGIAATIDTNGNNVSFGSSLSGAGGVTKVGSGTLTFATSNTYTGVTTVSVGTLLAAQTSSLPYFASSGSVSVASALLFAVQAGNSPNWTSGNITTLLGTSDFASGSTFGLSVPGGSSFTYSGNIGTTQAGKAFTMLGPGLLNLGAANTYTGGTTVAGGTLQLGTAAALLSTGAVNVNGTSAVLDLGGLSPLLGAVTLTAGTIQNGTLAGTSYAVQNGLVSASLTGTGGLTATGNAFLAGSNNTYTGTTAVNSGNLTISGYLNTGANTTSGVNVGDATNGLGVLTVTGTLIAGKTSVPSIDVGGFGGATSVGALHVSPGAVVSTTSELHLGGAVQAPVTVR